ncbi:MAG: hypothetical protein JEZ07_05625 [Phycisphaerae bacterium]|nr:hypothetical protein [Phycisphaerae bacterium]
MKYCLVIITLLGLGFNSYSAYAGVDPEPSVEAQMMALGPWLVPDMALARQIETDLDLIRTRYPQVADISYRFRYVPS